LWLLATLFVPVDRQSKTCKRTVSTSPQDLKEKISMAANKKCLALAAELADELRKRVSNYASFTESFDANGFPTISLNDGSAATTEDNVFIRVRPREWALATDVLGTAQTVYTPSVIQIAVEGPSSGVGLGRFVSVAHLFAILNACGLRGTRVEYWSETNGTVPSATTFNTASKMLASFEDLYWNMQSSQ